MVTLRCTNDEGIVVDLDIIESSDILLDISAIESTEIGKVFGVSSQQFALPGTDKNQAFFGYLDNLGTTPGIGLTKTLPCQVQYNGAEVFTGKLYVNNIVTDQHGDTIYNVVVVNETVDFKLDVQNLYVGDLDWSDYNHSLTYTNISQSWNDQLFSGDIVYPLCNYGFDAKDPLATELSAGGGSKQFDNKNFPLRVTDFKPSIKAKALIDKIFESTNYTYTSSFFNSAYFDTLYLLSTQDDKNGSTFVSPVSQSILAQANVAQPFNNQTYTLIDFNNEIYDNAGNWNDTTSVYTANESGSYTLYTTLAYTTNGTASAAGPDLLEINFLKNGSDVVGTTTINIKGKRSGTLYAGPVAANLLPTDTIEVQVYREHLGSNTLEIVAGNRTKIQIDGPGTPIGGTVNVGKIFDPKDKVLDVLNGLIQQFNLVIEPVAGQRNVLSIEPFNTWVDAGTIVDWTDKVDRDTKFEITHPLQSQPKKLIFSNIEDTDVLNKYTKDKYSKTYGEFIYESDSDLADGERRIGTYFAPTPLKGINGAPLMVMPILAQKESSESETPFKFKPRLLHKIGLVDADNLLRGYNPSTNTYSYGNYFIKDESNVVHTWDQYMLFHHLSDLPSDFDSTKDIHFGNTNHWSYHQNEFNAKTKNSAFFTYWAFYVNELYDVDSRLLTCNIYLDPTEIQDIKLNDKLFIDGHYYRINKISGANLLNPASVKVELLKTLPRKSYFPRRRIIDTYTGEWERDVYADWNAQDLGGIIVYKDWDTDTAFTGSQGLGKVAPKDDFTVYGNTVVWNTIGAATPEFVATSIRGNNQVDASVDKANITGDNNVITAAVNKVNVLGDNNSVGEYTQYSTIQGTGNTVGLDSSKLSLVNTVNSTVTQYGSNISFINTNGTTITSSISSSDAVVVISDVNSTIDHYNKDITGTTTLLGTRGTTLSGSINDLTIIGTENINITGGNYHVVIGKDDEISSTLDLNRYRTNTNVLNGTYLDDDVYLNRDSFIVDGYNGGITYAYSGDGLYKWAYDLTWNTISGSGTHTIELPSITSQDQYGRTILFKADSTISPTSSIQITSSYDLIDDQSTYTLDNPYGWVELRADYFLSGEGYITEWRVINSSQRDSRSTFYGNFYSSGSQALLDTTNSQSVRLDTTREANGMYKGTGSDYKIYLQHPGTYKMEVVAHISNNDNQPQDAYMWLKYNGSDWPASTIQTTIPAQKSVGNPSTQTISISYIGTSISPTDYVELWWGGQNTNLSLQAYPVGASPTRPAAPSVSITITPVN